MAMSMHNTNPLDSVPIIDVTDLESRRALAAIDRACRDWGFFQVTGHGIDRTVIDDLFAAAHAFFAQPSASKRRILRTADNPWGFFDQELTKNTRDWKEVFDFGPADGAQLVPQWPNALPQFEPAVRAFYASCEKLARRLLASISVNLGVSDDYLAQGFSESHTSFLRLNYYPKCALAKPTAAQMMPLGVNPHTDSGAVTLLLQDRQPGLEVFNDGRWYLIEPRDDALVINIGDIVQVWSNDRYKAALHRVITDSENDRYSVPFFFNPSASTSYKPLPTTVNDAHPPRYRPISWREFRSLRAAGDYADYGKEVQISDYLV